MSIRYAVATGNWSNTATWNGGTLPGAGDDVYSNNYTVTIDQSINVGSLNNGATTGVSAGGGFTVSASGLTITCSGTTGITAGSTTATSACLTYSGSGTLTVNANCNGGQTSTWHTHGFDITSAGTVIVNGNIAASYSGAWNLGMCISGAAAVTVNGNVTGGGSLNGGISSGVAVTNGSASLTVNGNVTGGTTLYQGSGIGGETYAYSVGTVTINGTVTGGSGGISGVYGIQHNGTLTITGNVVGSAWSGVYLSGGACTINGNVTTSGTAVGLTIAAGTATLNGNANSSATTAAVSNSGTLVLNGNMNCSTGGFAAVTGSGKVLRSPSLSMTDTYSGNSGGSPSGTVSLSTGGVGTIPAAANVRSGTSYGVSGSPQTGTLAVPSPSVVLLGNATDNTTGTLSPLNPNLLLSTTVATVTNQTTFRLATGSPVASYTSQTVILANHSNTLETFATTVSSWTGGSLALVIANAAPWTVTANDTVQIVVAGSNVATDSSGRVLLQPTQTGVTIPTVTTVTNPVTVGTNNDKSGYSLTQSFPAYFASQNIDSSGRVLLQPSQPGVTIPTITTYTGNTPQTGDAYARLGAPAGASVSADIAAAKAEIDTINTQTTATSIRTAVGLGTANMDTQFNSIYTGMATAGTASAIKAQTDKLQYDVSNNVKSTPQTGVTVTTNNDKNNYNLASTGLDSISTTTPTNGNLGSMTFRQMVIMVYRRFFKKSTMTSTQLVTYADDDATAIATQALSDNGTTQTMGDAS